MIYCMPVDLGQSQDYTVASLIQRREAFQKREGLPGSYEYERSPTISFQAYDIRDMWRPPLKTAYVQVVDDIQKRLQHPRLKERCSLVVDATGAGRPVIELMWERKMNPIGIIITGGHQITIDKDGFYHVPKKELVTTIQLMFESGRLRVADFTLASAFREELLAFTRKMTKAGNDTYEAFVESAHDDMVMSVAMGLWYMESLYGPSNIMKHPEAKKRAEASDDLRYGLS
jgi:hypothetical protein